MSKLSQITNKFSSWATIALIVAISLGVTGGAAMALDDAVTHHSFGVVAFALALGLAFIWIVSGIIASFVKPYKLAKGGESGRTTETLVKFSLAVVSLVITIVALAIH